MAIADYAERLAQVGSRWAPVLALALIAASVFYAIYQTFFSALRTIPGPFLAKVSPLWRVYRVFRGSWQEDIVKLHQQYGPYVRIAPNEVSTTSPTAVGVAYSHTGSPWVKDVWYETWWLHPQYHPSFAETNPAKHRNQRRRVSKLYSMSNILSLESCIDGVMGLFFSKIRQQAEDGKAIDFTKWTQFLMFDVVGELGFGGAFGQLSNEEDWKDIAHWVFLSLVTHASLGWTWFQSFITLFPPARWLMNRTIYRHTKSKITAFPFPSLVPLLQEKGNTGQVINMVEGFRAIKNSDGTPVDPVEVSIEIANIVIAGADTTAISFRAVVYYVATNHRVYEKLCKEIDAAAKAGHLSALVTFKEAQAHLPYLQLVIKEALRLYPAVGFQLPRLVPQGGAHFDGHYFPGNTVFGTNAWALHRNPAIYGPDCNEFRPERWQVDGEISKEQHKLMEDCYGSFGYGSRTCLGKNMGLMELSRFVPTLFRDYEVEICDPQKPWTIVTAWFSFSQNFHVRIRRRKTADTDVLAPITS